MRSKENNGGGAQVNKSEAKEWHAAESSPSTEGLYMIEYFDTEKWSWCWWTGVYWGLSYRNTGYESKEMACGNAAKSIPNDKQQVRWRIPE
jgi:hypothetical protein